MGWGLPHLVIFDDFDYLIILLMIRGFSETNAQSQDLFEYDIVLFLFFNGERGFTHTWSIIDNFTYVFS